MNFRSTHPIFCLSYILPRNGDARGTNDFDAPSVSDLVGKVVFAEQF